MHKPGRRPSPLNIYHTLILGALGWVLGNVLINLLVFRRPSVVKRMSGGGSRRVRVSVLVPARNEERRLGPCLESLAAQTEPAMEVLVLDDNSTDATHSLAWEHDFRPEPNLAVATDVMESTTAEPGAGRRRLLRGHDLPPGWIGKNWACWQLAQAARGDWLVFTDADTVHEPECIASAVAHAERTGADLLTVWPRQITLTWSERLVIPLGYLLILGFLPQWLAWLVQRSPRLAGMLPRPLLSAMGAANGQFLMVRRTHYYAIGGHRAVRGHLVEDLALGQLTMESAAAGCRVVHADGSRMLSCRMYEGFADLWEGFSKNLRPAFAKSGGGFAIFGAYQFAAFILPFAFLFHRASRPFALVQTALILGIRAIFCHRYGTSRLSALLHPIGHGLLMLIGCNSWRLIKTKGVSWKGRVYK